MVIDLSIGFVQTNALITRIREQMARDSEDQKHREALDAEEKQRLENYRQALDAEDKKRAEKRRQALDAKKTLINREYSQPKITSQRVPSNTVDRFKHVKMLIKEARMRGDDRDIEHIRTQYNYWE
jgi:hypothetical protein